MQWSGKIKSIEEKSKRSRIGSEHIVNNVVMNFKGGLWTML